MWEAAARLFDPFSLMLVVGGTLAATLISSTRADLRAAVGSLRPLLRGRPDTDALAAERAVRQIKRILDYRAISCVDRVRTPVDFVSEAARRIADVKDSAEFHDWAEEELSSRRAYRAGALSVWRNAAEVAPAMGMIGTVIGLVSLFAGMSDPRAMGPGLSIALLTTLYGLFIAACIAGPAAARLERLAAAEEQWQRKVLERLETIAAAEEEAMRSWAERRARAAP